MHLIEVIAQRSGIVVMDRNAKIIHIAAPSGYSINAKPGGREISAIVGGTGENM